MRGSYVPNDVRNMIIGMREAGLTLSKMRDIVEDLNQQFQVS